MNEVRSCPQCGTAAVQFSVLGGDAKCEGCGWTGSTERLIVAPFSAGIENVDVSEAAMDGLRRDIKFILQNAASPIISMLVKWGFLEAKNMGGRLEVAPEHRPLALRYMNAIANGFIVSIIEERKKIEVERGRGNRSGN